VAFPRSVRGRLTFTLVALVALTAALLGIGSYLFVDYSLHDQAREEAASQARFDLGVLIPQSLPEVTREALNESGLQDTFQNRGVHLVADFGDAAPEFASLLSPDFEAAVGRGEIGYQWVSIGGQPSLVTGGRLPGFAWG
jgi:hypothetical protein